MSRTFRAPGGSFLRREWRAAREPFRLAAAFKRLRQAPTGLGAVMVMPGYSTGDMIMAPLRWYLRSRGYRVWGWGLGMNRGNVDANTASVIDQVEQRFIENGRQPIALVGWSLGGAFARSVTKARPELVSQVITMATPLHHVPNFASTVDANISHRIEQPITAFYSQRDGVVDWRACLDETNPNVDNIEVDSSHVGMIIDPTVWIEIAHRLG